VTLLPPPKNSAGPAPRRMPGSVRRTSSIDAFWPDGQLGNRIMIGRARDVVTPVAGGPPAVLAEDSFRAILKPDRTIVQIDADPPRPSLSRLVGSAGGSGLRRALEEIVPEERRHGTPLYLILDDIAGVSLVSSWAWSQWDPDWLENSRRAFGAETLERLMMARVNICTGLAEGSSAFDAEHDRSGGQAPDLRNPDDPEGWHAFPEQGDGTAMRRARRIDVWLDEVIVMDSAFQDSATTPAGTRRAVHEYVLRATADPVSLRLLSVEAEPRVLPHAECPGAAANVTRLLGTPLPELRDKVLEELRGVAGCTHLNDAMRALADVPTLASHLRTPALQGA